tara:strand:+ start:210 stop:371 length:162 start_codon:yes stop_codon:yes gene_type:complete
MMGYNDTRINGRKLRFFKKRWVFKEKSGDPYGIRTRVAGVKGQCPRPLDEGVA